MSVGGIEVNIPFFVMDGVSQEVILGRPWERMTRIKHDNRDDGSCFSTVSDKYGNSATFCSVPANHERNRESAHCNGGQAMTARGWLQGALGAMDAGYGQRGKAVGKAVGECREVIP